MNFSHQLYILNQMLNVHYSNWQQLVNNLLNKLGGMMCVASVRNIVFEKAPEIEKSLTADSRPAADRIADPRRRIKPLGIDLCLTEAR